MSKDCEYNPECNLKGACSYCNWKSDYTPIRTKILTFQETLDAMRERQGVYKKEKCQR